MIKNYSVRNAIMRLYPESAPRVTNNDSSKIFWQDGVPGHTNPNPRPTDSELDAAGAEIMLEQSKKRKCEEINTARDIIKMKPYNWPEMINGKMRVFEVDIENLLNHAIVMDDVETSPWICEDDDYPGVELNKSQIIAICRHVKVRRDVVVSEARRLKNEVLALTSVDAVETYTFNLG